MDTVRVCSWCGAASPSWCEDCTKEMENRSDPGTMTKDERKIELEWFFTGPGKTCEVPFNVMHKRMEQLMGRPVWTHEFANTKRLMAEFVVS